MDGKKKDWSRRDFLKTTGAAGIASLLLPSSSRGDDSKESTSLLHLPTRPFGKTGNQVSMLALGGSFDTESGQLLLRWALNFGVTYWETAERYLGGRSEKGFGKYFKRYPEDRKKVFLVTKTTSKHPADMTAALEGSLERMNTSYIDLYLWHRPRSLDHYDQAVRDWVQKMKSEGKIRLFGFSTHRNMAEMMMTAATLGGIDGIQVSYNFRHMQLDEMKKAVAACAAAGIGLTAMKTVGSASVDRIQGAPEITEKEMELLSELTGQFLQKDITDIQARLMAVWQNPHIASICSYMPNMAILESNVNAALNWNKLSRKDMGVLKKYARATSSGYCLGCAKICESAVGGHVPISDVMRFLMYYSSYQQPERARSLFNELSTDTQHRIVGTDYSLAEQKCPQKMAIGRIMRAAAKILA